MRILVVPSFSGKSAFNDKFYNEIYSLSKFFFDSGLSAYWYFVVPSWVKDGLFGHEMMEYIYLDSTKNRMINDVVGFPAYEMAEKFSRRGGSNIVDVVITDCVLFSSYLRVILSDMRSDFDVPVVIRGVGNNRNRKNKIIICSNYAENIFAAKSHYERDIVLREINKVLMPNLGKMFAENSLVWPKGYNVDKSVDNEKSVDNLFFVCGSFYSRKKKNLLDLAGRLVTSEIVDGVSIRTKDRIEAVESVVKRSSFFDMSMVSSIKCDMREDDYTDSFSDGMCFVSVSADEIDDNISCLFSGQIGVFPYEKWAIERLGENYPFYYNSGTFSEAEILISWIVSNFNDAKTMIFKSMEMLKRQSIDNCRLSFWKSLLSIVKKSKASYEKDSVVTRTSREIAVNLGDEFSLDVFLDVLEERISWLQPFGKKGTVKKFGNIGDNLPTLYDLREILDSFGWKDQFNNGSVFLKYEK